MSKANPRKAMAALLPLPVRAGEGVVVRPMTLGMWAALERIESPLVTGKEPKDTMELIPSLYLLTHDPREVFRGNVLDLSMQWADTQPVTALEEIRRAAYRQMNAAYAVIPEDDDKDAPKKKRTAGSPSSPSGAQRHTTGRTRKSCGTFQSRRSASSAGPRR